MPRLEEPRHLLDMAQFAKGWRTSSSPVAAGNAVKKQGQQAGKQVLQVPCGLEPFVKAFSPPNATCSPQSTPTRSGSEPAKMT